MLSWEGYCRVRGLLLPQARPDRGPLPSRRPRWLGGAVRERGGLTGKTSTGGTWCGFCALRLGAGILSVAGLAPVPRLNHRGEHVDPRAGAAACGRGRLAPCRLGPSVVTRPQESAALLLLPRWKSFFSHVSTFLFIN